MRGALSIIQTAGKINPVFGKISLKIITMNGLETKYLQQEKIHCQTARSTKLNLSIPKEVFKNPI